MQNQKIGQVYKIVNTVDDEFYIGSTSKSLNDRFSGHKNAANDLVKLRNSRLYCKMRLLGTGLFSIVFLESVPFTEISELRDREQFYIETLKPEINQVRANLNVNYEKERYEVRKEEMSEWGKQRYIKKKDEIKAKVKVYADNNKEVIAERGIIYRDTHKTEIKERRSKTFECECGAVSLLDHKARHLRTKKHIDWFELHTTNL